MKQGSTLFLKFVVFLIAVAVFALCIFLVSELISEDLGGYQPIVVGMLLAAIPFFIGVIQTLKLLNYIDQNKAFSKLSVKALKTIKYCAALISVIYAVGLPYIFIVAEQDDAPGGILLGLVSTFAPLVVAVFSALLQNLLENAIDLKSENELTV